MTKIKHLFTLSFIFLIAIGNAAEDNAAEDKEQEPITSTKSRTLGQPSFSVDDLMTQLRDPSNLEPKGGIGFAGILSEEVPKLDAIKSMFQMLVQNNEDLRGQLGQIVAVQRSLSEAQQKADDENRKLKAEVQSHELTKAKLLAADSRILVLDKKREELLIDVGNQSALASLEKARREELQHKTSLLSDTLVRVAAKVQELETLERVTSELEESLALQQGSDEQIADKVSKISFIIDQNKKKIEILKAEKSELEISQKFTAQQVELLKSRIEENDHYTLITKKISDRSIEDHELWLYMVSVCTILQTDLDTLSIGHDKRIIELLIKASLPNSPRPEEFPPRNVPPGKRILGGLENRFRHIGNDFIPSGGLGWVGTPFDLSICVHEGSQFQKSKEAYEAHSKEYSTMLGSKKYSTEDSTEDSTTLSSSTVLNPNKK